MLHDLPKYKTRREWVYLKLKSILRYETIEETGFIIQELHKIERYMKYMLEEDTEVINEYIEKYIHPIVNNPHYFDFLRESHNSNMAKYLKYEKVLELNEALDNVANNLTIFFLD